MCWASALARRCWRPQRASPWSKKPGNPRSTGSGSWSRCVMTRSPAAKSLLENSCGLWLCCGWLTGEAPGHDDDHRPVDVGFVVGGQPLIVSDGAPVAGDPRQRPLHYPPAGQDLEGVQVIGAFHDLQGQPQPGLGPGDRLPGVAAVGPGELDGGERAAQVPQQRFRGVAVL